jgi:hypothetical protein
VAHSAASACWLAWAALSRTNTETPTEHTGALPDIRRLFGNRDVLLLIVGYAATIWGTAGLRQWIVVFLAFCVANHGDGATQNWSMLAVGALIGFLGVPAGLYGMRFPATSRRGGLFGTAQLATELRLGALCLIRSPLGCGWTSATSWRYVMTATPLGPASTYGDRLDAHNHPAIWQLDVAAQNDSPTGQHMGHQPGSGASIFPAVLNMLNGARWIAGQLELVK